MAFKSEIAAESVEWLKTRKYLYERLAALHRDLEDENADHGRTQLMRGRIMEIREILQEVDGQLSAEQE